MTDRGVLLLFFDVPCNDKKEQKAYRALRKALKHNGFLQVQESVYAKLVRRFGSCQTELQKLCMELPDIGKISVLPLHLTEWSRLCTVAGYPVDISLFADDFIAV